MARKPELIWHEVHDADGRRLGRWTIDGGVLVVRSALGGWREARPSEASNAALARLMLGEEWASAMPP